MYHRVVRRWLRESPAKKGEEEYDADEPEALAVGTALPPFTFTTFYFKDTQQSLLHYRSYINQVS